LHCSLLIFFIRNFFNAFNFTYVDCFINPSKASVDLVAVNKNCLVLAGHRAKNAVFLTSGLVAQCDLIVPGVNGYGTNSYRVKKIGIWPFAEEFEHLCSFMGECFKRSKLHTHIFADILSFATQKEGANTARSGKLF
jgi:hypothetical protein